MSTTTYIPGQSNEKTTIKGFFRRLFDRVVYSQSLAAERIVSDHFRTLPARQLEDLGFSKAEIYKLQNGQILSEIR